MSYENTHDFAAKLDRQDKLSPYRDCFHIPQHTELKNKSIFAEIP